MRDPNRNRLIEAAQCLRPLLGELVFVGGSVTGLLLTDEAASAPRTTLDVDAIAEITSYYEYIQFADRLRSVGFEEDRRGGAPLCRWVRGRTVLDVMPLDGSILGFSNRWYRAALDSAVETTITDSLVIRLVTAPCFVATKLEAFHGRGEGDFLSSHDMEDVVAVVDGRPSLLSELRGAPTEIRMYLRDETQDLLANSAFLDALPGYLLPDAASQSRLGLVLQRMRDLAM